MGRASRYSEEQQLVAVEKLRDGLTYQQVADLYDVSDVQVWLWKKKFLGKGSLKKLSLQPMPPQSPASAELPADIGGPANMRRSNSSFRLCEKISIDQNCQHASGSRCRHNTRHRINDECAEPCKILGFHCIEVGKNYGDFAAIAEGPSGPAA